MSVDLYSPRSMAAALQQMKKARSFMRQLMIRAEEEYSTENVDVDIQTGARRLAPFINPNIGISKQVDRIGYSTQSYTAPMVSPKRSISVTDIQKRLPGESLYSAVSPDARAAQLLGQDLAELDDIIMRTEEWMCAQAAINSAIAISGDDVSETITFSRTAALVDAAPAASAPNGLGTSSPTSTKLTTARTWDQSTADIPTQLQQLRRLFQKTIGISPTDVVMGADAADYFLKNTAIATLLDSRRMDLGLIAPEIRDGGATYLGSLRASGVDLWAYDEWYIDANGVEQPMIPANKIVMLSRNSYTVMRYGAVAVSSGDGDSSSLSLVTGRRVPQSWVSKEPAVRFLKVSARPLVVPVQNDAYAVVQVLS